jgi:hypothetical protein
MRRQIKSVDGDETLFIFDNAAEAHQHHDDMVRRAQEATDGNATVSGVFMGQHDWRYLVSVR